MMGYSRPNNRGVLVGRVTLVEGMEVTVALDSPLEAGDTLEFWTRAGRFAQAAGAISVDGIGHPSAPVGAQVKLTVSEPVSAGDRVFRVRNSALSEAAARTFRDPDSIAPIELSFAVHVVLGEPLRIEVVDGAGRSGRAQGAVVEPARTKAVTADEITEHVGRLGGTPYRISRFELELSPDVGLGFSALHRCRREALLAYESQVLAPWSARPMVSPRVPEPVALPLVRSAPRLVASVANERTAAACLAAGADAAYVPIDALGEARPLPAGIVAMLPRICHDRAVPAALAWARAGVPLVVGNLGLVREAARLGARVEADWGLNALNRQAIAQLDELGASFAWLSPELSGRQLAEVVVASPLPAGMAIYGRQELMVTEHCVLMAEGPCDRRCGGCERRAFSRRLRDRKGYEFPVRTDVSGRSHLYNAVTLDLSSALPEILAAGVAAVRVDAGFDDEIAAASAVSRMRDALDRAVLGVPAPLRDKSPSTTSGHFYRGVL